MLLTVFPALVFCAAVTLLPVLASAFVQDTRFFSSAPKEARKLFADGDLHFPHRLHPLQVSRMPHL